MSVSNTTSKAGPYATNGVQTVFPFAFKVFSKNDLLVVHTDALGVESTLAVDSAFTVALNADQNASPGGSVTTLTVYAASHLVTVVGAISPTQQVSLTNFRPDVVEKALDKATLLIQQAYEKISRAVLVDISSGISPSSLLTSIGVSVSNAAASALAALTSANNAHTSELNAASSASNSANSAAAAASSALAIGFNLTTNNTWSGNNTFNNAALGTQQPVTMNQADARYAALIAQSNAFSKLDSFNPVFIKTGASTLSIKAGTKIDVLGTPLSFGANTAVVMPALTGGTDYAIYACQDGTIRADSSFTAPSGYSVANSRQIGGFHYGLVAAGTTVASGSFATTGTGMIWTQTDVDNIAGINLFSLWDLKFRPQATSPKGMALVNNTWVDIYLCSTDSDTNGTSKYNTNIASGTVLPKKPVMFGGNGTVTYATPMWWDFSEIARSQGKRFPFEHEFVDAAFGVTENQSIDATASTYPTTLRNAGYTSKYGIEQASGHHYIWGQDSCGPAGAAYSNTNGGRGQVYNASIIRVLLGGSRTNGAYSGSRASNWNGAPWFVNWGLGLRAVSDHLILV